MYISVLVTALVSLLPSLTFAQTNLCNEKILKEYGSRDAQLISDFCSHKKTTEKMVDCTVEQGDIKKAQLQTAIQFCTSDFTYFERSNFDDLTRNTLATVQQVFDFMITRPPFGVFSCVRQNYKNPKYAFEDVVVRCTQKVKERCLRTSATICSTLPSIFPGLDKIE